MDLFFLSNYPIFHVDRLCHFGRREIDKPRGKLNPRGKAARVRVKIENNPNIGDHR